MSDIAIRVENLSKRYRIGLKEEMHDTLFGAMADFVRQPIKNLRRLRQLSRFEENGRNSEDIIWALKDVSFEVQRGEVVGIPSTAPFDRLRTSLQDRHRPQRGGEDDAYFDRPLVLRPKDEVLSTRLKVLSRITYPTSGWENIYLRGVMT